MNDWLPHCIKQQTAAAGASTHKPVHEYVSGLRLGSALLTEFSLSISALFAQQRKM